MAENIPIIKALPPITPESKEFWAACERSQLLIQQCDDCGKFQFYPRILCTSCGSASVTWMETSGRGRIKSFTIIRRAVSEAYEPDVPYVIGLIELDEGPTMMSKVLASDVSTVSIGEPVTVSFERYTEQVCVPVFRVND